MRALEVIEQQSAQIERQSLEIRELREQNAQLTRVNEELRQLVGEQAARLAEADETLACRPTATTTSTSRSTWSARTVPRCQSGTITAR